jgi:hypothetical protein
VTNTSGTGTGGGNTDTQHELMLLEYERSSEFCNHVDGVRNVITSFFLTVVGGAAFLIDRFSSAELKAGPLGSPTVRVVALLYLVATIGLLFVVVIARLRRVQLERYAIMNGILDRVLTGATRDVVPFANTSIAGGSGAGAMRRRSTGSYFWTMILVLPGALLVGIATALVLDSAKLSTFTVSLLAAMIGLLHFCLCDMLYFRLSK